MEIGAKLFAIKICMHITLLLAKSLILEGLFSSINLFFHLQVKRRGQHNETLPQRGKVEN
jgi:hypothetical protein